MNLIKVENDTSYARDSSGAIVNTNVAAFQAAMQRKKAKEESLQSLLDRVSDNEEKIKKLTDLVEKMLTGK